jgi:glutamate carboxypeptidase
MDGSSRYRDQVLAFVERHADEQLQFVVDLCDQNSYTYNRPGANAVAEMVLRQLEGILPVHEVIRQSEVGDHHILRTRQTGRSVYLLGHLDTVFPPEHPFQRCRRDGDWLYGPGTGDMKGGLAVMVYALKVLAALGALQDLNITLVLGADEEIGSANSHTIYETQRENAAACMAGECAGTGGEVVISRNGKAGGRIDCFGADSHVGRASAGKASAILEMAHKIVALESLNGRYEGATVNVGKMDGGLGPSTVPAHASCLFDLRWQDESHCGLLEDAIRQIARKAIQPGCRSEVTLLNHRPAMPLSQPTREMLAKLRQAGDLAGVHIGTEHRRGTSDANYFGAAGVPTIDGFGPVCEGDHTPSERILIPSLAPRTALLAFFLKLGTQY